MPSPKPPSPDVGSTFVDAQDDAPTPRQVPVLPGADEAPGATAVVRVEGGPARPAPLPPSRRPDPTPRAPRKGLQISLPDETPAGALPIPKPAAPLPEEKRGRRGAWWDAQQEPAIIRGRNMCFAA